MKPRTKSRKGMRRSAWVFVVMDHEGGCCDSPSLISRSRRPRLVSAGLNVTGATALGASASESRSLCRDCMGRDVIALYSLVSWCRRPVCNFDRSLASKDQAFASRSARFEGCDEGTGGGYRFALMQE